MLEKKQPIALITGATDGIGKETALQLAKAGVSVILGARNLTKGHNVVSEFNNHGLDADVVLLDLCDEDSIRGAALEIEQRYGQLDILINNAGIALDRGPMSELSTDDLVTTYETNLFGTFRVTKAFLPLIRRSAQGRIVNVSSSLASFAGMTDPDSTYYHIQLPVYASSKAALNVLTIHLARELIDTGIKVNAVDPGLTATRYVSGPGAQPVEKGAEAAVRYALIDENGPTGGFFDRQGAYAW